jgi:hypothetical protein
MKQLHHSSARSRLPKPAAERLLEILLRRVLRDEQNRCPLGVVASKHRIRTKHFTDVGHHRLNARWNGLAFREPRSWITEEFVEHVPNPRMMDAGLLSAALKPVFVGFAQASGLLRVP